jgi:Cu(I)/Ag(I) efflux system membrane protein CusA/SilA
LAITLVPVLCTFLIRGKLHREDENPLMRVLRAIYRPVLAWALRHRAITLCAALALLIAALYTATTIGSEFMPPLDEETALFMPITDPRISLTEASRILRQQDQIISADPAVAMVVGKVGRAETSTDPAPVNMSETTITFKPKEQWPKGLTKDAILSRLDDEAADSRRHQHLDATDSQSDRHAFNRHPHTSWHQGLWSRPWRD